MERLTKRVGENGRTVIYVGEHKQYEDGDIPCEISDAAKREVLKRLAAYEDTGLTPEEIEELLAVCREIASFVMHYSDEGEVSAEVLCRKLHKIGLIEKDGAWWTLPEPPKGVE